MTNADWIALATFLPAAIGGFAGGYVGLVLMISRSRHMLRNEMHVLMDKVDERIDRLEDRFNARFGGD